MPWENGRKRRYSDVLEDPYQGPTEFMEAGARGFLITCIPDREEHSLDETVRVLRKTCVKLYGGIKPLRREDASFAKGYIMVDFMKPENVVDVPHPDAEKFAEEQKAKEAEEATKAEAKETEAMEEENKQEQEESTKPEGEATEDGDHQTTEKAEGDENTKEEGDKEKEKEEKEKEEKKKKEDWRKKRREEEERSKAPLMMAPYKFKMFRTELRNIMFVKSDIPDPLEVLNATFEMILDRKPLYTDCVNQLLPVQGVCDNDYKQLEIMCRRVLVPYFGEHLEREEPPSFGVMLVDKMCEPGAELLLEVVRSAIWGINPSAWQCSPWTEPDVVVHIEIIGSKIILSAMPHYMKYRQYSPFVLHELGVGKPENEEDLLKVEENKDKENNADKGRKRGCRAGKRKQERKELERKEKEQGETKEEGQEESKKEEASEDVPEDKEKEVTQQAAEEETEKEAATETSDDKKSSPEKKTSKTRKSKS